MEPQTGELIHIPLVVDSARDGFRLDRFLATRIVRLSRTRVQQIVAAGRVRRADTGEVLLRPGQRMHAGEALVIDESHVTEARADKLPKLLRSTPLLLKELTRASTPWVPLASRRPTTNTLPIVGATLSAMRAASSTTRHANLMPTRAKP